MSVKKKINASDKPTTYVAVGHCACGESVRTAVTDRSPGAAERAKAEFEKQGWDFNDENVACPRCAS